MVILVTAQDVFLRFSIYQMLRNTGHSVLHAGNAEAAILISAETDGQIDLLVAVHDDQSTDAFNLSHRLRVNRPLMKTVIILESVSKTDDRAYEEIPILRRPFTTTALHEIIATAVVSPESMKASGRAVENG